MNNSLFYLLYSEDRAVLDKEIAKLKKELNIDENSIINYDIIMVDDIIDEALTISMFAPQKLIIIDATSYLSEKKEIPNINKLEDYFEHYNKNSYLVFISQSGTINSSKKIAKLISKMGQILHIEKTDTYLSDYALSCLKRNNYSISSSDLKYFLSRVGKDISNITNELDKLMLYKIEDKTITSTDINKLTEENIDSPIYELANSLLKNETEKALKLYYKFLQDGMDPSQLIPIIASQIRLLFQVKRLYNKGKTNEEIAKILELKNAYRVKYLLGDSYYYSEKDLLKYLTTLARLDKNIKLGLQDSKVALELFIAKKDM